jgi:Glycine-zipper domain
MRYAIVAVVAGVSVCALTTAVRAEVFVYPKAGSTQEQFQRDQFDCHQWAQGQTGVNPAQPMTVQAPPPERGGAVRGAAGGAALGAIGGAIAGDAGKGAAIGAGVGGAAGLMRQGARNQQAAQAGQQAQAQQQANLQRYEQAYAACLSGRGYQVR